MISYSFYLFYGRFIRAVFCDHKNLKDCDSNLSLWSKDFSNALPKLKYATSSISTISVLLKPVQFPYCPSLLVATRMFADAHELHQIHANHSDPNIIRRFYESISWSWCKNAVVISIWGMNTSSLGDHSRSNSAGHEASVGNQSTIATFMITV